MHHITDSVIYVGVNDHSIDLFEGQYIVPKGISYNAHIIMDEKIALMDTVDARFTQPWLDQVHEALQGKAPNYLIIAHLEPDHAGSILAACRQYPNMQLVMSAKAQAMLPQFIRDDFTMDILAVKEGDSLSLGQHTLHFVLAPMVHWPEVLISYESTEKILFSADAFGTFGALDQQQEWLPEARRYYLNIVGKYGGPVQTLLKKASKLDIAMICPLHGPVLSENLPFYLEKYHTWSSYAPEEKGVFIAFGTLHGNTAGAARYLCQLLQEQGVAVSIADLARDDMAWALGEAFRYDKMVLACPTYDGRFFPKMEDFLLHLKAKGYQKRQVHLIENGSWGPMAAKYMREYLSQMTDINLSENVITIKSTVSEENKSQLRALAALLSVQ